MVHTSVFAPVAYFLAYDCLRVDSFHLGAISSQTERVWWV